MSITHDVVTTRDLILAVARSFEQLADLSRIPVERYAYAGTADLLVVIAEDDHAALLAFEQLLQGELAARELLAVGERLHHFEEVVVWAITEGVQA